MADHSVRSYLQRRTTNELQAMLMYYLRKEKATYLEYIVDEIVSLLQERAKGKHTSATKHQ